MGKYLCRLLLAFSCVTLASAATRLRVGVENNAPPLSYVDAQGQPTGFSAELLREMARAGGLEIEVVPNSWKRSFDDFQKGKLDALANMIVSDERSVAMDFSIGHAQMHGVTYYRADHSPLHSTANFPGKTIATLAGSVGSTNALRHGGWGATIRAFPSWQEALDATNRGECDAALFISRPGPVTTTDHGLKREFVEDIIHEYHFAVHKGDSAPLAQLNAALAIVLHNGTFDRVYSKWIGPIEPHPIRLADLRPYALPATVAALLLIAFIAWQRHMMRKLARQADTLRQSEERWKFALEGQGAAVWDWELPTGQMLLSHLWKEMLGFDEDENLGTVEELKLLIHPDEREKVLAACTAHWRDQSVPFAIEHRMRCKNGSWKWIHDRGMVVRRDTSNQPLRMIGTFTDLTLNKQIEQDRLTLGKLQSTGILAGGIAHDFNNLLTAIILNLDLAQTPEMPREDIVKRLRDMQKAAFAARDLTQQLITFSKGGVTVRQPAALAGPLREAVRLALSGSSVRSEISIAADLWPIEADLTQIGQVMRNLVINAREAMAGSGTVSLQAENVVLRGGEVHSLPPGNYVRVSVTDHGHGIAPNVLPAIFDPYFSTKQRGAQKGMGLGLTICHTIVQQHSGAIIVASVPDVGTIFHVYLPATEKPVSFVPAEESARSASPFAVGKILVMDDEETVRASMELALKQMGYAVESAPDGTKAVELYRQAQSAGQTFSAVILDLTVRDTMGGLVALEAIRALDPAVHAIVMSGYADDEVLQNYAHHGFKHALIKPFSLATLRQALAQIATSG